MNDERALLRRTIATVAYRAGKALRGAPPEFAAFQAGPTVRTPLQIVSHIADLYEWALHLAKGERVWNEGKAENWDDEVSRFFEAVREFDEFLSSGAPIECDTGRLVSGPIADSLSHTGQIAMLRRLFGSPIRGENYYKAEIEVGRVGPDQPAPKREFD